MYQIMDTKPKTGTNFWVHVTIILLILVILLSFIRPVQPKDSEPSKGSKGTRKLQIGIKKRPEKCDHKSTKGDLLHIHYRGYLDDGGAEFDNSYKRGSPLTFTLGHQQVIQGWDTGLMGICEGEKRKLVIPPDMGYGSQGSPPNIPPNAVLIFEVECLKIEEKRSEL